MNNADLIARLRARSYVEDVETIGGFERVEHDDEDASAAADALEAAEAQVAALEAALEPFVRSLTMQEVEATVRDLPPSENADRLLYAMVGDARRARVALAKGGDE